MIFCSKLKHFCTTLSFYIIALFVFIASPVNAEPFLLSVVLSENGGAYSEFSEALQNYLLNSEVKLSIQDTTKDLPKSDLVIAVGMKAASNFANSKAPAVLNVMITKAAYHQLLREFPGRENSPGYSAIYLDQPVERQLSLIAAAFPERANVGLLYHTPPLVEISEIRQKAGDFGLKLFEQEVKNGSMFEPLQNVLKHSDVLLALPDPAIFNTTSLRNILVSTYQAQVPVIGFSSAYVKAGAICAVYTTPVQFATQTGLAILKFAETETLPRPEYSKFFEISINERVAKSLSINIKNPKELALIMASPRKRKP